MAWHIKKAEGKKKNNVSGKKSFKLDGEIRTLPDKQKPSYLINTKPVLQEMLNKVLNLKEKSEWAIRNHLKVQNSLVIAHGKTQNIITW